MGKALSGEAIEHYKREGYLFPVRVMSEDEAAFYRAKIEAFEAVGDGRPRIDSKYLKTSKMHLLFTWANALVRHPRILDVVEDLLGPDLLVWGNSCWIKEPRDPGFVSWHQDSTYWGLTPPEAVISVWLALTPATVENGAMRFVPRSHAFDQIPHKDTYAKDNMLSRGQVAQHDIDEARTVNVVLKPGEISLHHIRMLHASKPNTADERRIGFAARYIPPYVRQANTRESAKLVRGEDTHGYFDLEPDPAADLDPDAIAAHNAAVGQQGYGYAAGDPRREGKSLQVS
ncbi:MAG: phytanoyl-CoA dioxygenase family protein [Rhodospirillales bacterium]|nr:phytanoyl-CoA dioxygenase family protein [Rhodospirillales bacterium]